MLVFRDGGRRVALRPLLEQLVTSCRRARAGDDHEAWLAGLLRAGELECGLADAESAEAARVARVTDALADALLGSPFDASVLTRLESLSPESLPNAAMLSVPEGFAYYALHPLDYSDAVAALPQPARVVVVGIRSIGTTLSAAARAAFTRRGVSAERITVRPTGHPWDRETRLSPEQERLIAGAGRNAHFVVVDEGPGLSGSSFLSVAEALAAAGVPRERITLLGSCASQSVDASRMRARDAAARWARFRYVSVAPPSRLPRECGVELSGGEWRRHFLPGDAEWLASWTAFERRKFLARDGGRIFKFEGLGHYGEAVRERSRALAQMGFSPAVADAGDGFAAYQFVTGIPLRAADANEEVLRRIAAYCAARAKHLRVPAAETAALTQLITVNWREAFGEEVTAPALAVERPVIADARVQPHEWVRAADGTIWKADAASHGDDHFFPGPTDIAWDLAGAIIEWELDAESAAFLLSEYRRRSRDDAEARLPGYLLAYALFRLGYCEMAADAMRGSPEEPRLRRDAARYRRYAQGLRENSVAA